MTTYRIYVELIIEAETEQDARKEIRTLLEGAFYSEGNDFEITDCEDIGE